MADLCEAEQFTERLLPQGREAAWDDELFQKQRQKRGESHVGCVKIKVRHLGQSSDSPPIHFISFSRWP